MADNITNSNGDVIAAYDISGVYHQRVALPASKTTTGTATCTASTSEQDIVAAGGASVKLHLLGLIVTNTSATGTEIEIRDAAAGSVVLRFYAPPNQTTGVMLPRFVFPQTTANNKWTAKTVTSVSSVYVTGIFQQDA